MEEVLIISCVIDYRNKYMYILLLKLTIDFNCVYFQVLGWRDVPFDNSMIGKTAVESQPLIRQVLICH